MSDLPPSRLRVLLALLRRYPGAIPSGLDAAAVEQLIQQDGWSIDGGFSRGIVDGENPSFRILDGACQIPEESLWKPILDRQRDAIARAIASVGRIETTRHDGRERIQGTGWLIRPDTVVTNRHVAGEFADIIAAGGARLRIDLREEIEDGPAAELPIRAVLPVETDVDLAFLRIDPLGRPPPAAGLDLATQPRACASACAIGFPANPDIIYHSDLLHRIFAHVFGVKRLSPGTITAVTSRRLDHDCTTLGGSSGSLLLDLDSGEIVGIHYGEDRDANHAVPAPVIAEQLARL